MIDAIAYVQPQKVKPDPNNDIIGFNLTIKIGKKAEQEEKAQPEPFLYSQFSNVCIAII